eukprot:sb/3462763/
MYLSNERGYCINYALYCCRHHPPTSYTHNTHTRDQVCTTGFRSPAVLQHEREPSLVSCKDPKIMITINMTESTEFDQSGHIPTQYYSNWLIFISGISDSNKPCVLLRTGQIERIDRALIISRQHPLTSYTHNTHTRDQVSHIMDNVLIMHYTAVDITHSLHTHTTPTHVIKSVPQDFDHRLYYSTRESRNSNPPVSSPCLTWELPRESTEFDQSGHIPTQYYSNWLIFISGISDSNKPCVLLRTGQIERIDRALIISRHHPLTSYTHNTHTRDQVCTTGFRSPAVLQHEREPSLVSHIMDNVLIMHYTAVDITHSLHTHTTPTHVIKSVPQDFDHRLYYSTRESRNSNPPVSSPCLTWELPRESTEFDQSGHIPTQYYSNWLIFISGISDSNKPCVLLRTGQIERIDRALIISRHHPLTSYTHNTHTRDQVCTTGFRSPAVLQHEREPSLVSHIMDNVLIMHYTAVDITHSLHTHTTPTHVIKSVPQDFDHRLYYSTRESRNSNPPVSSPCLTWELPRESTEFDQSGHIPTQYYSNWLIFISGISDSNKPCVLLRTGQIERIDRALIISRHHPLTSYTHNTHTRDQVCTTGFRSPAVLQHEREPSLVSCKDPKIMITINMTLNSWAIAVDHVILIVSNEHYESQIEAPGHMTWRPDPCRLQLGTKG